MTLKKTPVLTLSDNQYDFKNSLKEYNDMHELGCLEIQKKRHLHTITDNANSANCVWHNLEYKESRFH